MKPMTEPLEPRQMFAASAAAAAATDAVLAFRTDLRSLNAPLGVALVAYENVISEMSLNVVVFKTPAVDSPLLVQIRTDFRNDMRRLSSDITIVKTLLNQELVNLVLAEHELARKPTNLNLVNLVSTDGQLLTEQAQSDLGPIASDCAALVNRFFSNSQIVVDTHPLDPSLATEVASMNTTLASMSSEIQSTNSRILYTTVPNLIAALAADTPSSNAA